jgi:predicted permease
LNVLKLFRRLKYLIARRRIEEDFLQEVDFHRAMEAERLERAGLDRPDAQRASRRTMGNVTLAREDARAVWIAPWFDSVRRDIGYALRIVLQRPAFTVAIVLVIGLGIGSTAGVFSLVDTLVLKSLPVEHPERLVFLDKPSFSYPVFTEVRARAGQLFSSLFAWNVDRLYVQWTGGLEPTEVLLASGEFYSTLGVKAALGRTFDNSDDRVGGGDHGLVAVISDSCWTRRFSRDPGVIGRQVRVERRSFTIIGVTPAEFFGVAAGLAPDITVPLTTIQDHETLRAQFSSWLHLMGRLRDDVSLAQANAEFGPVWQSVLGAITDARLPPDRRAWFLSRQTRLISARTGFSPIRNQFQEPLWMLFGLVGLMLAVSCGSASNLLLARGAARRREIAVRLAIGATRARLVRQMLTEAFIWNVLGAAAGVLLAVWGEDLLVRMMMTAAEPITLDVHPGWRVVAFVSAVTLATTTVSALLPALRATRVDADGELKSHGALGRAVLRRWSFGKALVAIQVSLTMLLLTGAALFARSLQEILNQNVGFNSNGLIVLSTDPLAAGYDGPRLLQFYESLLERLRHHPSIEGASLSRYAPIAADGGSWTQTIGVDGAPPLRDPSRQVYFNGVSPDYLRTVGIHLVKGRDFTGRDTATSRPVVIVNESLVRQLFDGADPIGRRLTLGLNPSRRDLEIVGVVRDSKYQRLQEPTHSIAYLPCAQLAEFRAGSNLVAEIRGAGGRDVRTAISRELRALDGVVPYRVETVDDRVADSLVKERVLAVLAGALGMAALVLACAAVYGLLAHSVSRQTNEIGLRLAFGASRGGVLWTVLRESLAVASIGVASAIPIAIALGRFIRTLLFGVTPLDPPSFIGAALLLLLVAATAALAPARRAAAVDPVCALKAE